MRFHSADEASYRRRDTAAERHHGAERRKAVDPVDVLKPLQDARRRVLVAIFYDEVGPALASLIEIARDRPPPKLAREDPGGKHPVQELAQRVNVRWRTSMHNPEIGVQ
jgi:hypothetical protein